MTRRTAVRCGVVFFVLLVGFLPVFAAQTPSTTVLKINGVDAATVVLGQTVTLHATVTGATPTGLVTFTDDDGTVLGAATLDGAGVAQMTTPLLSVRAHTIAASYPGDGNAGTGNAPSSDTATVTVGKRDATVAVTVDPLTKSIKFGELANVSATVTSDVSAGPAGAAGDIPGTAALSASYSSAAAVRLPSGKVLITGGMNGATNPLAVSTDVYVYDPAGGATSNGIKVGSYAQNTGAGETLNTKRAGHTMTVAQDGTVIVIGGSDTSGGAVPLAANALDTAEVYNPADQTIVANPGGGIMGTARMYHTATLLPNGKILIIGGEDNSGKLATVELYDPSTHTFSQPAGLADLNVARSGHTATIYSTDVATTTVKIFVSGGDGATYEVYTVNYATNTGTAAAAAIAWSGARDHATATMLPDGRILIAGGQIGGTLQTSVIAFAPASNLATAAPAEATLAATLGKAYLAGVLLNDATVQFFGGLTSAADATTNLNTTSRYITGFDPTGSVTLSSDETLDTVGSCPLAIGTGTGAATCTSTVIAGAVGTGTHAVSGVYGGDGSHKVGPNAGDTTDTITVAAAKPVITGVTSKTTTYGTASLTLTGTVSFTGNNGVVYPPAAGETVSVDVNGSTGSGSIGANGAFSINFDPSSIPYNATAYPATYSYTPVSADFVAADDETTTTLTVNKGVVTAVATASNKAYDGNTNATITNCTLTGAKPGDVVTCAASAAQADNQFDTRAVGTGKTVTANNITVGGADIGNYDLSSTTATTTANISRRNLTPVPHGVDRPYDGTTVATATFTDDRVAGDVFTYSYTADFEKKNPGTWPVTVTNIAISGTDAGNYQLTTTTGTTSATITSGGSTTLTAHVTASNKTYDGNTLATITACTLTGVQGNDQVTCSASTTATDNTFDTRNIGTGKTVTATNITLGGPDAGTYTLGSSTATTSANITAKALTASVTASDKVYNGDTLATITSCTPAVVVAGETVTCAASAVATDNTFDTKNVGAGKMVTAKNITLGGADAGNYTLGSTTATTTASVTVRTLSATPTGVNKTYDGTTNASVTYTDDRVAGDSFTYSATAAFDTKNVGTAKPITVSAVSISSGQAANYTLVPTSNTTGADVNIRSLTPVAHGVNKPYDTTTTATVTFTDDRVAGDVLNYAYTANFSDKTAGTNKPVSVTGIAISGGDSGNYSLTTTTGATTANITQAPVTAGVTALDKVYDGNTTATIATCTVVPLAGDTLTCAATAGAFDTKNVGTGKTVMATNIGLGGADAANYALSSTSAATTANVTVRTLTATPAGVNRVYDATTNASVTYTDDRVAGDTFTYTATAAFNDKNIGTAKPVTISTASISTGDAPNYTLTTTANTTTADITKANLTPAAQGIDKAYDGTNAAAVTITDNRAGGDNITYTYTSTFSDKNVGTGKPVTVSGIAIGGADSGNYNLTTTTVGTTATIDRAHLTVTADNQFKVFDTAMYSGGFTWVIGGFVTGETDAALRTAGELSGQPSFSGPATTATAVGMYAITPATGSLTATNYDFTVFVDGTLSIDKTHVKSLNFTTATAVGANVQVTAAVSSGFPANLLAGAKADFLLDGTVFASNVDISSGTASAIASGVTSGTHSLKVNFLGNQSFFADSQTLQVNSTSAIPGEKKTLNISVANNALYGFAPGPITYGCVLLEPSITCTVSADSATLPANFTVTVQTTPSTSSQPGTPVASKRGMGWLAAAWFGMPGMVFVGLLAPTSRGRKLNWSRTLTVLAFISIMLLLCFSVGCGGGNFSNTGNIQPPGKGGTPAGTYIAQVTGTQGGNTQVLAVVPVNVTF